MANIAAAIWKKIVTPTWTPASDELQVYFKADGLLYVRNSDGIERPLVPVPDQLHTNANFDTTAASTTGNQNTGTVASREMPTSWDWGWSFPTTALAYPTLVSATDQMHSPIGKSLKITYTGSTSINQYVWGAPFAAPSGASITVSAWCRGSNSNVSFDVGILSANSSTPNVFVSGFQIQSSGFATSNGVWTKFTGSFIMPSGHTHARIQLRTQNSGSGDGWFDDTEASMQVSPPAQVLPGMIFAYGGSTAPPTYFMCNGGTFDGTANPTLATLVGDTFGTHSGSNYYLPDLRGRVILGVGTASPAVAGGTAHTLGQKGGEEAHTQTAAEAARRDSNIVQQVNGGGYYFNVGSDGDNTHRATLLAAASAASAMNVLDPYLGLNYIIKGG